MHKILLLMFESSGSSSIESRFSYSSSTESSLGRKISYPTVSTRASNLREFSITDLSITTQNFSQSSMVGSVFGHVFRGTVRNLEDPSSKIEVTVKQFDILNMQVSLFPQFCS